MTPEEKAAHDQAVKDKQEADAKKAKDEELEKNKEQPAVDFEKITLPEDVTVDDAAKDAFLGILNDKETTAQEKAQKLIDLHVGRMKTAEDAWETAKKTWRDEVINDPDFGGAKLQESVKAANAVVRQFGDDALKADLIMLGLGNKLSVVRFLNKIHAATKNDSISGTSGNAAETEKPLEERMWPGMGEQK